MSANLESVTIVPILGKDSIHIGSDLLPYLVRDLISATPSTSIYEVITDTNVAKFCLEPLVQAWDKYLSQTVGVNTDKKLLTFTISPGETSKSYSAKSTIEDFLITNGCNRDTCIIALGGGVIGDLVGFVASTFMRGVPLVQIPTSLLAMVDSSIGGKNGINISGRKNMIGTFWQPIRIYVNLDFLESLPRREIANGMAEIIKAAAVSDADEFFRLQAQSGQFWNEIGRKVDGDESGVLLSTILAAVRFKTDIVTKDQFENGMRELLNFGHTIGHGIEGLRAPKLLHGECVAIGMCQEVEIAVSLGKCSYSVLEQLKQVLDMYDLPTSLHDPVTAPYLSGVEKDLPLATFMSYLGNDKKGKGGKKRIVLLAGIGTTVELNATSVSDEDILRAVAPSVEVQNNLAKGPASTLTLAVPGSKSISNRSLPLAALGEGPCNISGLLHSEDTKWMTSALKLLTNRKFTTLENGDIINVSGPTEKVVFSICPREIYLGNCGTAARFLTSLGVLVARESGSPVVLTGNKRMKERPIGPLVDALRSNGAQIDYMEREGSLPIKILPCPDGFSGGKIQVSAKLSSQYVSSLLMAAPYAKKDVNLELVGDHVSSQAYIDITLDVMESFGVKVTRVSDREYLIPAGNGYVNPTKFIVEGDASSATYPLAVAAITGGRCTVTNLGNRSFQGDSHFARKVLEPMGCIIEQNGETTTVQGPPLGTLKSIPSINMESMTDAFLTASVLAAVAETSGGQPGSEPITSIVGIANTRVKECDRIAVVVEQLKKFGVDAWEIADGLEIKGSSFKDLNPTNVQCYEDHRVSMAFSVLGTIIPGTVILDKHCVGKSWPGWWIALNQALKVNILGVEPSTIQSLDQTVQSRKDSSVVLIGMKKGGKTTLGKMAANKLGFEFVDLDDVFVAKVGMSIQEFIQTKGWDLFRDSEAKILKKVLMGMQTKTIISTGGGIVENPENREYLKKWMSEEGGIVIHIDSDWDDMNRRFEEDLPAHIPYANSESFLDVAARRAKLYTECSNYQFERVIDVTKDGADGDTKEIIVNAKNLTRLIQFASGELPSPLPSNPKAIFRSFFLCLALPDISTVENNLSLMVNGIHAVEIRVDHLRAPNMPPTLKFESPAELAEFEKYIAKQIAILRYRICTKPIIYTIRSASEGGLLPDEIPTLYLESLYNLGLRLGCEFIDVQRSTIQAFAELNKGHSKVIASYHSMSTPIDWGEISCTNIVKECSTFGDIVKIVGAGIDNKNNQKLELFREEYYANSISNKIPLIAVNMGRIGQPTRLSNSYLTPVTHFLLPNNSAPGQLTLQQILQGLSILGQINPKSYYIFGHQISYTKSPIIHSTIFRTYGLPHTFDICDTDDLEAIAKVIRSESFGGSCITIPHKEALVPFMDTLSSAAKVIGAINTIVRLRMGDEEFEVLHGDNTDWIGMFKNIEEALDLTGSQKGQGAGLVLGAGGTAKAAIYALSKLGFADIWVYNRSKDRRDDLIGSFEKNGITLRAVEDLQKFKKSGIDILVVVDTCPSAANMCPPELVEDLFRPRGGKGVLVGLAYNVQEGKDNVKNENIVRVIGLDILIDQAVEQSEIWTGLRPSRQILSDAIGAVRK